MRIFTSMLSFLVGTICGCSQYHTASPSSLNSSGHAVSVTPWPNDWSAYLGQTVTLEGNAENVNFSAYLVRAGEGGEGGIFIDGLHSWPGGCFYSGGEGKRLRVTGTVIKKDDVPVFVPRAGEPMRAGIPVKSEEEVKTGKWRYLLKDAKWMVLD